MNEDRKRALLKLYDEANALGGWQRGDGRLSQAGERAALSWLRGIVGGIQLSGGTPPADLLELVEHAERTGYTSGAIGRFMTS